MTAASGSSRRVWSTDLRSRILRSSSFRSSTFCLRRRERASVPGAGDVAISMVGDVGGEGVASLVDLGFGFAV